MRQTIGIYVDLAHDDVIKWKLFPRYSPFVRGIHRSPVNSPHKGQWRGTLMFSSICAWFNDWVNHGEAGDLRRYRAHYVVTVMLRLYEVALHLSSIGHLQWNENAVILIKFSSLADTGSCHYMNIRCRRFHGEMSVMHSQINSSVCSTVCSS